MSSETMRLPRRLSGTSPSTTRCASPSTTAVLPTPGSPISTGLFFVRRDSTCTTRRISVSRPITGSSSPRRARSVRSTPYFSSALYVDSGSCVVTRRAAPRTLANASSSVLGERVLALEQLGDVAAGVGQADEQVLGRDVVVADLGGLVLRHRHDGHQRARQPGRGDVRARRLRQPVQQRLAPGCGRRRGRRRRRSAAARRCRRSGRAARAAGGRARPRGGPRWRPAGRPSRRPPGSWWSDGRRPRVLLVQGGAGAALPNAGIVDPVPLNSARATVTGTQKGRPRLCARTAPRLRVVVLPCDGCPSRRRPWRP